MAIVQATYNTVNARVVAAGGREEVMTGDRFNSLSPSFALSNSGYVLAYTNDYDIKLLLLARPSEVPLLRKA